MPAGNANTNRDARRSGERTFDYAFYRVSANRLRNEFMAVTLRSVLRMTFGGAHLLGTGLRALFAPAPHQKPQAH